MPATARTRTPLSTADARRDTVITSAIQVFATNGYLGTPIAAVAEHARISPAYVFKLFPGKETLFVAALDRCFELIEESLARGAEEAGAQTPSEILFAMGGAYADLIGDRSLLLLQVHAQSVAEIPEIGDSLRRGLARVTRFARDRSGAGDAAVQRFIAYGQLCHLIVTAGLEKIPEDWAQLLTDGIRHPETN
ncbi:TetR/AcrR family transcriptional regulator [Diaminobutyricibacter sp. McL0618]|uniref:TetR/AcrR family transcriptional regulator n=1 Tax=Leifsonia sp. McL0618 TaxID=3415677 RepID=UPI003CED8C9A